MRAKRERQIEWIGNNQDLYANLTHLGRETQQSVVLDWLLGHPGINPPTRQLQADCGLKSNATIKRLAGKSLIREEDGRIVLAVPAEHARLALLTVRGVDKYVPVIQALMAAGRPLWQSELYGQVDANLNMLRDLQTAGLIQIDEKVRFRDPLVGRSYPRTFAPRLTGEQAAAWLQIQTLGFGAGEDVRDAGVGDRRTGGRSSAHGCAKFLIHGVTGSGKTELYLRAIGEALAQGRQAIALVPEIALTPQTIARFAGRFPNRVTVIHSALSVGERYDVWRRVRAGDYDVVVGPRSALFAPLPRLGLIILDEEHESSYKQDAEAWGGMKVYYDARRVADKLAELVDGVLILGSATPSLEAYYAAEGGDYRLLEMPQRVMGHRQEVAVGSGNEWPVAKSGGPSVDGSEIPVLYAGMPPVEVVDMRQELRAGNRSIMSRALQAELHATLDAGEQAILFLNRRGSSTFVMCRDCGAVQKCAHCEVPLTYHERANVLVCHHCNKRYPIPEICPGCSSKRIKYFGSGTQRIEDLVHQISPRARVLRWDADTTTGKGSHEAILRRFAGHEADVLVGTQMIAKGLDLPLVTLVGVISADVGLYLPDFRSGERTFQLLTQVAGRAGRSQRGGRVVVQTYTPDHYVIQAAARHDYSAFYRRELSYRQEYAYPPIRRMARLVYWDKNRTKAEEMAVSMAQRLQSRLQELGLDSRTATLLGPAPAFFARYRGYYRWQLIVCADEPQTVLRPLDIPFGWRVDIDPVTVL